MATNLTSTLSSTSSTSDLLLTHLQEYLHLLYLQLHRIPGSPIILRYISSSYQNDPFRSVVELFLVLFALRYLTARSYTPSSNPNSSSTTNLTDEEIDDLVEDWTPEPLVPSSTVFEVAELEKRAIISGATGPKCRLTNGRTVTNLASYNFYNLATDPALLDRAIQTLRTYGVGPCGPPGFYGTQDVHMTIEADIASFLGTTACIIYAQAFSTMSSVIPAFSKRGDVIVADKAVNYSIRKGMQISRSRVLWYEHNDMADLERVLAKVAREQKSQGKLTRRFIVAEGISENVGDILDLKYVCELKQKYKFRLILDETWSFAVLGRSGRGLTEHAHVDAAEVDMLVGSMAGPICAAGGFCAGSDEVVEHQRLSAAAYTFSAALPAMSAVTASEVIRLLQSPSAAETILTPLRENIRTMWTVLQLSPPPQKGTSGGGSGNEFIECTSSPENPIMLLVFKSELIATRRLGLDDQMALIQDIVDECLAQGVLITRAKSLSGAASGAKTDVYTHRPTVKICLSNGLTRKEIERAGAVIKSGIAKIMGRKR